MAKLLKCEADDWVKVYVDGKLIQEGHSFNEDDFLKYLVASLLVLTEYKTVFQEDSTDFENLLREDGEPQESWEWYDAFCDLECKKYFEE